jgi:transposase
MSTRLINIDRNTPTLLPPDLRDWVKDDDLVHFIADVSLRVSAESASVNYRGCGSAQYPPSMMLALLLYCYSQGIYSSRKVERATYS